MLLHWLELKKILIVMIENLVYEDGNNFCALIKSCLFADIKKTFVASCKHTYIIHINCWNSVLELVLISFYLSNFMKIMMTLLCKSKPIIDLLLNSTYFKNLSFVANSIVALLWILPLLFILTVTGIKWNCVKNKAKICGSESFILLQYFYNVKVYHHLEVSGCFHESSDCMMHLHGKTKHNITGSCRTFKQR